MSWYGTSFRKLFFDFHNHQAVKGLASAFDAERWADRLAAINVQAVSVTLKCIYGWSFYHRGSVRYVHPNLPAGLDMVETQIKALHQRGIKAIGYYHAFNSEPIARDHPDWIRHDVKGEPESIGACMMSPLLEEWIVPHLKEILTHYDLDAMFFDGPYAVPDPCYCPSCKKRYKAETGKDLPKGSGDKDWSVYVKWMLDDFKRIRKRIAEVVHQIRPDIDVSFNWGCTIRTPEPYPEYIGNLMIDVYPEHQMFDCSYQAKHWATSGKPFDVMNSAFMQWWGDWVIKRAESMQHEVATVIANGGLTWIGFQMTHTFDVAPAVMNELGKTLEFVRQREPLLVDARPKAGVAVLHSTDSSLTGVPAQWLDEKTMRGAHKLLMESALPHHFVDENWLTSHIKGVPAADRYPVVVLAEQQRVSDELAQTLTQYVQEGGGLLVTGSTATLDENYKPVEDFTLGSLLGLKRIGKDEQTHCYFDVTDKNLASGIPAMPTMVDNQATYVQPTHADVQSLADLWNIYLRGDGKPLLKWSPPGSPTGYPAITFRRVGRGCVAYLSADVFRAFQVHNLWPMKQIVANLIRKMAPNFPVSLAAPAWLEVAMAEQKANNHTRTIIHLVNHHGINNPVDKQNSYIEQTLPVHDVVLTLRRPNRPVRVSLQPQDVEPRWHFDGQQVIVEIPRVDIHTAVVVE